MALPKISSGKLPPLRGVIMVAVITFALTMVVGALIYRTYGMSLGFSGTLGLAHAAMGLGFFTGFLFWLRAWVAGKKKKESE